MSELPVTGPAAAPTGKLLALDVGLARIGVAVCDPLQMTVRPVTVLQRRSRNEDFEQLARLVQDERVQAVVCGLPISMDGSEGEQARTTRKWAERLAHALRVLLRHPLRIIFWDERLTTFEAQSRRHEYPRSGEDAIAAVVLLESFLAAVERGEAGAYGEIDLPPKA